MPARILIADDQQAFRKAVVVVLPRGEFEVVAEAADGSDAIRMARRVRPDLAILNVTMTGPSGLDAMRGVLRVSPRTGVVAVAIEATVASLVDALCAGARGFIVKNRGTIELVMALRAVASGRVHLAPEFLISMAESARKQAQLGAHPSPQREQIQFAGGGATT
jgi:DNA-binding NarL/FixJ family response regulator